jgi:long-chain acyl-CoA synthetase
MVPSGEIVTYQQLEDRSNQCAKLLRDEGLSRGSVIAILMENHARYLEVALAADRSGLYYTSISTQLTASEAAYIVGDAGATVLFVSKAKLALGQAIAELVPGLTVFLVDGKSEGARDYLEEREACPRERIADESQGAPMLYSSGTTGRPKGVKFPLPEAAIDEMDGLTRLAVDWFNYNPDMTYLSPAPMYHTAPLRWSMSVLKVGGSVVIMEKFDAEKSLHYIQEERITHSQWVPTHFVRMLKLPVEVRESYDLSSLELAFHAAAPCPVPIKEQMLAWWGPIIHEFYAGTEFNGLTAIGPQDWLTHKGSVGPAVFGKIHILNDDGEELPARKEGLIYFEGGNAFSYHNDEEKTRGAYNAKGWSTLGDIGWLDEDGYLYLTDRKSFMIISGGVNIYPQEIEDAIITHEKVADVAVIGAPDEDLGERLVAIVQPLEWSEAGEELAISVREHLQGQLAKMKIPKQIDFMKELPRHPTGKLYKRLLRDDYWAKAKS